MVSTTDVALAPISEMKVDVPRHQLRVYKCRSVRLDGTLAGVVATLGRC